MISHNISNETRLFLGATPTTLPKGSAKKLSSEVALCGIGGCALGNPLLDPVRSPAAAALPRATG